MLFPLAVGVAAPPRIAKDAGDVVVVLNPVDAPALSAVPPNAFNSAVTHELELLVPSRYSVPEPTLALYNLGVLGDAKTAVPGDV